MACEHDLAEREAACYTEGLCPICSAEYAAELRSTIDQLDADRDEKVARNAELLEIVSIGARMREFQKKYFRFRNSDDLALSKKAEAEFDKALAKLFAPSLL